MVMINNNKPSIYLKNFYDEFFSSINLKIDISEHINTKIFM